MGPRWNGGSRSSVSLTKLRRVTWFRVGGGLTVSVRKSRRRKLVWEQTQQALNHSIEKVITGVANLLPGLVALIVALLVSAILAWILGYIVRRSLLGFNFDERIARSEFAGLGDWSPGNSPTR